MNHQRGVFLLEALVAILIFSLGVLGMVAMGAAAVSAQSDAHYRTEAANLTDEIASTITLNVDYSSADALAASLLPFAHQPNGGGCQFTGDKSGDDAVTDWIAKVSAASSGLPGATGTSQQIVVATGAGFNRVTVTVCWQAPTDRAMRRHSMVTYVNRR